MTIRDRQRDKVVARCLDGFANEIAELLTFAAENKAPIPLLDIEEWRRLPQLVHLPIHVYEHCRFAVTSEYRLPTNRNSSGKLRIPATRAATSSQNRSRGPPVLVVSFSSRASMS